MTDASRHIVADGSTVEPTTMSSHWTADANSGKESARASLFAKAGKQPLLPDVGVIALVPDVWESLWQTRHHVLSRLAHYFYVVWIEPSENWLGTVGERRKRNSFAGVEPAASSPPAGLILYPPTVFLPKLHRWDRLDRLLIGHRLEHARRSLLRRGCKRIILYLWRPKFSNALDCGPFDLSCYHIDDEYSFSPIELPMDKTEEKVITEVDQVFVHSSGLLEKKGTINPHTTLVPNGVDYHAYSQPVAEPPDLAPIPHPRIGYTGFMKRHLDWKILSGLSEKHPEWSFVFVGPRSPHPDILAVIQALGSRPNVYFLGPQPTEYLSAYPQHFDVCMMPYQANEYTRHVYPLKLHEYLASGRPIVGTHIRTLAEFADSVALASTMDEWSTAIKNSLSPLANSPARRAARQEVARRHDWEVLVQQIASTIAQGLGQAYKSRFSDFLRHGRRVVDLTAYRASTREQERIKSLLDIIPKEHSSVLDIGGRDGYISSLLTAYFDQVTCLDLEKPQVLHDKVVAVKGDASNLEYPDGSFDVVLCAEVLEHIPPHLLSRVCGEIGRVAKYAVVVGVPYKQDCRVGRTTCRFCGKKNPCWGHINVFDERRLKELFKGLMVMSTSFVGQTKERTNSLSAFLMDLGGNPWGTYEQEESCVHCGSQLIPHAYRTLSERIWAHLASLLNQIQAPFVSFRPNWIHVVFLKTPPVSSGRGTQEPI